MNTFKEMLYDYVFHLLRTFSAVILAPLIFDWRIKFCRQLEGQCLLKPNIFVRAASLSLKGVYRYSRLINVPQ